MQVQVAAFYWYPSEDDYEQMQSLAEDRMNIQKPYAEWLIAAEKGINELESRGKVKVIKIEAPTGDLIAWCQLNKRKIDSRSRNDFAHYKLSLLIKDGEIKLDI